MEDDEISVRVNKEKLWSCMKCSLCGHLFTEATTISECLHTFCKKCICDKIEVDGEENCPVCKIHLGVSPLERLRSDYNMDELKFKIFLSGPSLSGASLSEKPADVTPSAETAEAKEAKNKGPQTKKSLSLEIDDFNIKDSSENLQNLRINPCTQEETGNSAGIREGNNDCPEPLSLSIGKSAFKNEVYTRKKFKEPPKDVNDPKDLPESSNPKKTRRSRIKITPPGVLPVQTVAEIVQPKDAPVWISLAAAENQKGDNPLPHVPFKYLKMDRLTPVSVLKMYVIKRLNLKSDEEIDIRCFDEVVDPELTLKSLVKMWLESLPAGRKAKTKVGKSAEEFLMSLTYSRSKPPSSNQIN